MLTSRFIYVAKHLKDGKMELSLQSNDLVGQHLLDYYESAVMSWQEHSCSETLSAAELSISSFEAILQLDYVTHYISLTYMWTKLVRLH